MAALPLLSPQTVVLISLSHLGNFLSWLRETHPSNDVFRIRGNQTRDGSLCFSILNYVDPSTRQGVYLFTVPHPHTPG